MSEYIAGLCHMVGAEIVPFETLAITAPNDDEAVAKAVQWQTSTISNVPIDERTWLQVLCDGKAIYSKEFGRF